MHCLVIGSSVMDVFANLDSKSSATITRDSVTFHLGDKVPIDINSFALGGNGMNIAVALSRLNITTTFYTYLGTDRLSLDIEDQLKKEGVEVLAERSTGAGSLSFILDFHSDRIIFSHHPIRNHSFTLPKKIDHVDYLFISSIGAYWEDAYEKALTYATHTGTPIIFSPGSKQIDTMNDLFFQTLHASEILLINKDEAMKILTQFGGKAQETPKILSEIAKLGPTTISITDGKNGAYAYHRGELFSIESISHGMVTEKTGAGDAYAAGFLAALLSNRNVQDAMKWGTFNAISVMQETGAQNGLLTHDEMLRTLEKHATVKAQKL